MLFSTAKNPAGPDLKTVKPFTINLSGASLEFILPDGNSMDLPQPQGSIEKTINIYQGGFTEDSDPVHINLADRVFRYKGFLGENLGSISFSIILCRLTERNINLFDKTTFRQAIDTTVNREADEFNRTANSNCQIEISFSDDYFENNDISYLPYCRSQFENTSFSSHYAAPVSENCYLDISFSYVQVIDSNEPWYKLASLLEQQIINSIKLTPG